MSEQGQGIGQLITMHTLDFDVQARGHEYEAGSEHQQEGSDDGYSVFTGGKVHLRFDQSDRDAAKVE